MANGDVGGMKTQPRYTKDALRQQLVLAANRIISDSYDFELLAWDAEQTRKRSLWQRIKAVFA